MFTEIDYMTIQDHKDAGDWPLEWLPVKGLIPYIKRLGPDAQGVEIGVARGESSYHILDSCPNVTKLYGIDPYQAFDDWNGPVSQEHNDKTKEIAQKNLKEFEDAKRFIPLYFHSEISWQVDGFYENSMNFIYIDGDHSYEGVLKDLEGYYPYMKKGGIFAGHDFNLVTIRQALEEFRNKNKIRLPIQKLENNTWFWYV